MGDLVGVLSHLPARGMSRVMEERKMKHLTVCRGALLALSLAVVSTSTLAEVSVVAGIATTATIAHLRGTTTVPR